MTLSSADSPHWWVTPLAEGQVSLATDGAGLSGVEARLRLAKVGPNPFQDCDDSFVKQALLTGEPCWWC